ncbi:unnamed protein product [Sphagnum troendelagicum]
MRYRSQNWTHNYIHESNVNGRLGASQSRGGHKNVSFDLEKGHKRKRHASDSSEQNWGGHSEVKDSAADTSGWNNISSSSNLDWYRPPDIPSVINWDDSGAREAWMLSLSQHPPKPDPDLYIEKHFDWRARTRYDTLEDDRMVSGKLAQSKSNAFPRSPVILGLGDVGACELRKTETKDEKENGSSLRLLLNQKTGGSNGWEGGSNRSLPDWGKIMCAADSPKEKAYRKGYAGRWQGRNHSEHWTHIRQPPNTRDFYPREARRTSANQ